MDFVCENVPAPIPESVPRGKLLNCRLHVRPLVSPTGIIRVPTLVRARKCITFEHRPSASPTPPPPGGGRIRGLIGGRRPIAAAGTAHLASPSLSILLLVMPSDFSSCIRFSSSLSSSSASSRCAVISCCRAAIKHLHRRQVRRCRRRRHTGYTAAAAPSQRWQQRPAMTMQQGNEGRFGVLPLQPRT